MVEVWKAMECTFLGWILQLVCYLKQTKCKFNFDIFSTWFCNSNFLDQNIFSCLKIIALNFTILLSYCSSIKSFRINRRWHISTTPNTTKIFCSLLKLIQLSNMVTLSCLPKEKLELEEKKFCLVLKMGVCGLKTQQISIFWTKQNSGSNFEFFSLPDNSGWAY